MMDTINGVSLKKTSGKLCINFATAFSMGHRFLRALEKHADKVKGVLSGYQQKTENK